MVFVNFNTCFTDPKQFIRLIVLITCICVTFYQLEKCFWKLMHPPLSTSNKLIFNQSIKFPSITVCRKPAFKTNLFPNYGLATITEISNRGAFQNFNFTNSSLTEFMEKTTYSLQETLLFYGYDSETSNPDVRITSNFHLKFGQCHTFQTDKQSTKFSIIGGMFLNLIHQEGSKQPNNFDNKFGFNVFIHEKTELIGDQLNKMETYSQYIFVEPAELIYLTLEAKEFHLVDHPDERCRSEKNYSKSKCLELCVNQKLYEEFGCFLPWMRGYSTYPLCDKSEVIDSINAILNSEKRNVLTKSCDCPKPCHIYLYLPNIISRKAILHQVLHNNNSVISVYYTSNIVTVVEQIMSYDWSSFLSDLGGSLGLFLGLSVIGFIEVIEAGFRLLFKKRRAKLNEEEKIKSLKDQKMVAKLIEYLVMKKPENNQELFLRNLEKY